MGLIYDPFSPTRFSRPALPRVHALTPLPELLLRARRPRRLLRAVPHPFHSPCPHHHRRVNKGHAQRAAYAGGLRGGLPPLRTAVSVHVGEFCDTTDARVLAEQHVWAAAAAAATAKGKNEAFNCANSDVFTWKKMWKVLSKEFKVEFVEYKEEDEFDIVEMMSKKGPVWEEIVGKDGLCKVEAGGDIARYLRFKVVSNFKFQHVPSMNKSKEYGFFGFAGSFKSVRFWIARLGHMKIIP